MLRLPTIRGLIRRRILVNYRVDPAVIQRLLPARFRPKLHDGWAIAGICLIRLEQIRPRLLPAACGINSENAAHRVAVLWDDDDGATQEGVFIPRRDTSSQLNHLLGGRVFPGEHHKADFTVAESGTGIDLSIQSRDGQVAVRVAGNAAESLPSSSVFESAAASSEFFESGRLGYSATRDLCRFDGVVLDVKRWIVQPFEVSQLYSSYFANEGLFPRGSVEFDHALLMRNAEHEWHGAADFRL
jgi:hypothetical protein